MRRERLRHRRERRRQAVAGAAWWALTAATMAAIWLGSARADGARLAIQAVRGVIIAKTGALGAWPYLGFAIQKVGHFCEYLLLAALLFRALLALSASPRQAAVLALLLALAYAAGDEWHQSFVPGREPAVRDVLIDFAGAAVAVGLLVRSRRARPSGH